MVCATSRKTELKLTNVARASLEERMRDCEDFLRQRGLCIWHKDSTQARGMRERLAPDKSDYGITTYSPWKRGTNGP